MGWPAIQGYKNGEDVVADNLNRPLNQLAERTEYLLRLVQGNDNTQVCLKDVAVPGEGADGHPSVGQVVYHDPDTGSFALATAKEGQDAWFYADQQAMAVGVVSAVGDNTATVVLCGRVDFPGDGIPVEDLIADVDPHGGRHYLAGIPSYGKLTRSPSGPVIYVGDVRLNADRTCVTSIIVNPQYRDTGESHIHRQFVVSGVPLGGYAVKDTERSRYYAVGIVADDAERVVAPVQPGISVTPCGTWASAEVATYVLSIVYGAGAEDTWASYRLHWESPTDGVGDTPITVASAPKASFVSGLLPVGTKGLSVRLTAGSSSVTPAVQVGKTWTMTLPDSARAWANYSDPDNPSRIGFRLNLGMYPEMARYVPPVPENGADLTASGLSLRGPVFKERMQWRILPADAEGGPWLVWYGGEVIGDSTTTPFIWKSNEAPAEVRDIVVNANRMRVGPTGFVTSLQAAPGSPLRITAAQTGADAAQGALMVALDFTFTTEAGGVPGSEVVKSISGNTFKTGPVVEKIVAGPGMQVNRTQGVVTISASNGAYAGDFETIALKNAKQDVAGGIFPYTKLLGWVNGSGNVASGFTAKFRVPDHIPYKQYRVIVSASVFGEAAASSEAVAAFSFTNYLLKDFSLSPDAIETDDFSGSVASPTPGKQAIVTARFAAGYSAFDPVVIHGFEALPSGTQRQYVADLALKDASGDDILVKPGYFVGLDIARRGLPAGSTDTWYTAPLGFLSLRWNLVEA